MSVVRRSLALGASLAVMVASLQGVAQAGQSARDSATADRAAAGRAAATAPVSVSGHAGGAADAVAVDRRIRLALQDMDGTRLDRVALRGKGQDRKLVVGEKFRAKGRLPRTMLRRLAGDSVMLQNRLTRGGQPWQTIARASVGPDGSFTKTVRVTEKRFLHQHRYRVIATMKQPTAYGAGSVSAAATTTASSPTTTATGVVEFTINYTNSTGQDLVVFVPTAQTSQTSNGQADFNTGSFDLDKNQTAVMTYTNPPEGTSVSWYVNQQNCLGKCTDYKPNWAQGQTPKSITCSSSTPNFPSGSTTNVDLTSQFGAGYGGSIVGPEANCSFQLGSSFQNWWENHPVEGWVAAAIAVVIIAVLIVAFIPTGGTDVVVADATLDVSIETIDGTDASWSLDDNYFAASQ